MMRWLVLLMCFNCQGVKTGSRQKAFIDKLLDMACFADNTESRSVSVH